MVLGVVHSHFAASALLLAPVRREPRPACTGEKEEADGVALARSCGDSSPPDQDLLGDSTHTLSYSILARKWHKRGGRTNPARPLQYRHRLRSRHEEA